MEKWHLQTTNKTKTRNKRLQCKQHIKTCTISWTHALQCLLHVFGTFFQGALSWPLSSSKERKKGHLQKMSQNEDMFPEGNVVSTLGPTPKKNWWGSNLIPFHSKIWTEPVLSSTLGTQQTLFFRWVQTGILSPDLKKNIFLSSTLGTQQTILFRWVQTWILSPDLKKTYFVFNFGPH